MPDNLFFALGKALGPKLRKARWIWASATGTRADRLKLEYQVGLDLREEVRRQMRVEPDPRTLQVLDGVSSRLTSGSTKGQRFQFEAYETDEPNAFALPGGFIFASGSIVRLCTVPREGTAGEPGDELAFVLAHEIGHVLYGHAIERIAANTAVSLAQRMAPAGGGLAGWLAHTGTRFLETAYSRNQELEADEFAVRLAAAAGYDPQAFIQLLQRLSEASRSAAPSGLGRYFSTHPDTAVRIDNIRRYLAAHPV